MSAPTDDDDRPLDFAAISTHASVLKDTNRMVLRYSDAIRKYAAAQLRDADEADEVHLLVVQSMLEGRFSRADAQKGRFRFYVQRAVRNAVLDYRRKRSRERGFLEKIWHALVKESILSESDVEKTEWGIWREAVLGRAMDSALKLLAEHEKDNQNRLHANVFHTLARLMIAHPEVNSEELARRLGGQVGREFTAGCTRNLVMRMRKKLAELLVSEIAQQLDDPTFENAMDELAELELLVFVKPYLANG